MVNFVTNPGLADDMQQWGQYWGGTDQRAQQRWQDNEVRRRYDEASRLNLEEANSSRAYMAANADAFSSMDPTLAGLNTQDAPTADISNGADPSTLMRGLRTLGRGNSTSAAPTSIAAGMDTGSGYQDPIARPDTTVVSPVRDFRDLSPEESRAVGAYWRAAGTLTNSGYQHRNLTAQQQTAARNILRAVGLDIRDGGIVRTHPKYSNNQLRFPTTEAGASTPIPPGTTPDIVNAPTTPAGVATNDAGLSPDTSTPAPLDNGPTDPYGLAAPTAYQGTNDTSRALQPTREMRLLQISVQDNLRRADIAAAHGNTQVAQAAFAQALQGHAAYISQGRMAMYHAALAGSNDAMTTLFSEFSGVPSNAVRLQPTNESRTRFNLQIRNNQGQWVTSNEVPQSRQEILGGLQNLVDAAGATARTEANTQIMQHQIDAGARITEASMQQRTAILRMLADAAIARGNNQTAVAIQNGNSRVTVDSNGGAWVSYSITDAQGRVVPQLEHVDMQDVPTPATDDGNHTIRAPVVQPANGAPNAGVR